MGVKQFRAFSFFIYVGVAVLGTVFFVFPAFAQCIAGLPCVTAHSGADNNSKSETASCDADFMNQIYARAFQESEREVVVAGQDILKPDSVLELSCFDVSASDGLSAYNPIFSAANPGGVTPALKQFNDWINPAVQDYIGTGFSHDYLTSSGVDYQQSASPCDYVYKVQSLAQCYDFDTVGAQFYDFSTLVSADPRLLPSGQACSGTGITQGIVDVAGNKDYTYVVFDTFGVYPQQVTAEQCSDPVGTGLFYESTPSLSWANVGELIFGDKSEVEHKICVNPLCYYNRAQDSCILK